MIDIIGELAAVHRQTGRGRIPAGEGRTVVLRREYAAEVPEVWDAITDPERIGRWFLPVTGDFRLGGSYQLQGNAGGRVLRCEPPHLLAVTWVFGADPTPEDVSEVQVRLSEGAAGHTVFELTHTAVIDPQRWAEYGPGATGVGWDGALLGLGLHLRGEVIDNPQDWAGSAEARRFMTRSSQAWAEAMVAAGASAAEAAAARDNTTRFYAPEPEPADPPAADG